MSDPGGDLNGPTGNWIFIGLERQASGTCSDDACNDKFIWADGSSFNFSNYEGYFLNGMSIGQNSYNIALLEANADSINGANSGQYGALCTAPCGATPPPRTTCYESQNFGYNAVSAASSKEECEKLNQQRPSLRNAEEYLDFRRWWRTENDGIVA